MDDFIPARLSPCVFSIAAHVKPARKVRRWRGRLHVTNDPWQHHVVTVKDGVRTRYINGVEVTHTSPLERADLFKGLGSGDNFKGYVSDFKVVKESVW